MKNTQNSLFSLGHPLWLVGFRPFFTLAFISGIALPLFWVVLWLDWGHWDSGPLSPVQWHAHEMYYGFGWALLGGFLLTASKNWVKIRGLHGGPLALAVALWFVDRAVMLFWPGSSVGTWVFGNLFLAYAIFYLLYSLVKNRKNDSFSDNFLFWLILPLFIVAKALLLNPETFTQGVAMTTGLFRVAFAPMFERTMVQFMKNAMSCPLPRWAWLDWSIKGLLVLSVAAVFLPPTAGALLLLTTAALLGFRFAIWKPHVGLQNFGIGIMYLGYFGLTLHLVLEGMSLWQGSLGIGAFSTHVFTFFCMGMIIPSMMIRISQGHTGRKPIFLGSDKIALNSMALGGLSRVILTQVWPSQYQTWISLAGIGWSLCFAILAFRLIPYLFSPRIDGREH